MSEIYEKATNNVGLPPAAEAYCRVLSAEVERLSRQAERERIVKFLDAALQGPEGYRQQIIGNIREYE